MARRAEPSRTRTSKPQLGNELESVATPVLSGCTCGSGQQLEEEHERIMAQSRNLSVRADSASAREEELEQRLEGLDTELKRLQAAEEELQWSQEDVEAACLEAREALEDARQREKAGSVQNLVDDCDTFVCAGPHGCRG
eukprot:symbB.v1.2.018111.t1/scaffold1432.1/size120878/15